MENFWGNDHYPNVEFIKNKIKQELKLENYYYLNNDDIDSYIDTSINQLWNSNRGFGNWKIYYSMGIYFYLLNEVEFILKKENRNKYLIKNILNPALRKYVDIFLQDYYSPPNKINNYLGGKGYQLVFKKQTNFKENFIIVQPKRKKLKI